MVRQAIPGIFCLAMAIIHLLPAYRRMRRRGKNTPLRDLPLFRRPGRFQGAGISGGPTSSRCYIAWDLNPFALLMVALSSFTLAGWLPGGHVLVTIYLCLAGVALIIFMASVLLNGVVWRRREKARL